MVMEHALSKPSAIGSYFKVVTLLQLQVAG